MIKEESCFLFATRADRFVTLSIKLRSCKNGNDMPPVKTFPVLGEQVEILISGQSTEGRSLTMVQISPPGGGPPPHRHENEDESFLVLEGEYEFFKDGKWQKASVGDAIYGGRGYVHTFRNTGATNGRMLIFVAPAGFESYLEEISPLSIPGDMRKLLEISQRYGISFASPAAS
jgi:quercetin dioxygenase-like cupin family protein